MKLPYRRSTLSLHSSILYTLEGKRPLNLELYAQLLTVFLAPATKRVVFFSYPKEHFGPLFWKGLNDAYDHALRTFGCSPQKLFAKVFGAAPAHCSTPAGVRKWAAEKGLRLSAFDTGRGVNRLIQLHPRTGKVAVQYLPMRNAQWYADIKHNTASAFLALGTARSRTGKTPAEEVFQVFSNNPVSRLLSKQAIEEHSGWTLLEPAGGSFAPHEDFSVGLVFEDALNAPLAKWIETQRASHPGRRFYAVNTSDTQGTQWSALLGLEGLGECSAQKMGAFKNVLAAAVAAPRLITPLATVHPIVRTSSPLKLL